MPVALRWDGLCVSALRRAELAIAVDVRGLVALDVCCACLADA